MTPLDPKTEYEIIAYTGNGRAHPQVPRSATFRQIFRERGAYRGAVAHDHEQYRFLVFDMCHVEETGPKGSVTPKRWWEFISKEQAIAHALSLGPGGEPKPSEKPTPKKKKKSVAAMGLPDVADKIMAHSYQRSGVVAGGSLLSSGARQATVAFQPPDFRWLKLSADNAGVSVSEMVRQCVRFARERKKQT